ncbi:MAG: YraN family protein [Gammaproteobacteria bacterium]|jgi:putative endonuclease|nr:YraN family protein [Gammaproteobacteria bacterium]MCP4881918.1 YraN family protein [Gammaproteobacteria bacterium]MDP6165145.1 YraN family protein [Gammaproteobacteria bacterium]
MSYSKSIGDWAEKLAGQHIQQAGWHIVARNFHCRGGELDIIARQDNIISFIEVKFRRSQAMGGAINSITFQKQQRLGHAAQRFMQNHPQYYRLHGRFDLICVYGRPKGQVELQWLTNIFSLND